MKKVVTIALAGIGGYGSFYLRYLLDPAFDQGVRLIAGIDPAPERCDRLAEIKARGIPVYASLAEFHAAGGSADLTILATPIHLHAPLAVEALEHGSHVLCEKPLAATIQEARQMSAAARKAGRTVAIGYQWSFSKAVLDLKRDVIAGTFGRPLQLKCIASWPRTHAYYARSSWAGALKSSGGQWVLDSPANNATAHYLHNMFFVLGRSLDQSARPLDVTAELYRANAITNFDTVALRCRTDAGADVLFYSTHAVPSLIGPVSSYRFEKAVICYEMGGSDAFVARFADGSRKVYGNPNAAPENKMLDSAEAVRGGAAPVCGVEAAESHTLCINGAQDSMPEIAVFPEKRVHHDTNKSETQTWVEGLQTALVQCYDQGILPAEHGSLDWPHAGKTIRLDTYTSYPSRG